MTTSQPASPAEPQAAHRRDRFAAATDAESLAAVLAEERSRLREANQRQPGGMAACRALTELCDAAVARLLQISYPADPGARDAVRGRISVVATGGYGRREMCPFSDVDLAFIVEEEEDVHLDATVRRMFLQVMETFSQRLGLKVGYSYRTLSDATALDHQTQTALLDMRVVAGSHGLAERFRQEMFRSMWPAAFVRQKVAERRQAWEKCGGTLYVIEPEVRESPGGLRDLHLAEWLAQASFPTTRGDVWRQLVRMGAVSPKDEQEANAAREFLLLVRIWMHWETGRAADLVLRERQEGLAAVLGFQDDERASRVERFMERYYEHAENVSRIAGFLIERCLAERLSLTAELACSGSELYPAYPWVQVVTPRFLVELGRHFQAHALTPGYELRRMIAQNIEACRDLSTDPVAAEGFLELLRSPAPPPFAVHANRTSRPYMSAWDRGAPRDRPGVHETLKLLADIGALQRLLPELGVAYRRVPFDQVHRHTIGHHSLETVRALDALRAQAEGSQDTFRRAWAEVEAPELLYLAALLHDIGKLDHSPGHAASGAAMATAICSRLRLDEAATTQVATLVRHHLLMSETAQYRDLNLPRTVNDFAEQLASTQLLRMLLLLSHADIEATGVMSAMKVRRLEDLYYRAEAELTAREAGGSAAQPEDPERARRLVSRISRRLAAANLSTEQIQEHTDGMPVSYLLNTRIEQIAIHIRMIQALQEGGPVVEFDSDMGPEITTIHLCTPERAEPGLLSLVAGVLYHHEISIHGAQVFTREREPCVALDTLWVDYRGHGIPPWKRLELEQDLVAVLRSGSLQALGSRARPLPAPILPLTVRIDNTTAEDHTVVEVQAQDQPALLYRLARAMAALRWDIHSARISTRGDVARDFFYVTDAAGEKLDTSRDNLAEALTREFTRL